MLSGRVKVSFCLLLMLSTHLFAQDIDFYSDTERAYDRGYNDGYDDAMEDCPCPVLQYINSLGQFYVGGELGYESYRASNHIMLEDEFIGSLRSSSQGGMFNVFGGYGRYFDPFYIGGEIFIGNRCANGQDSINTLGSWDSIKLSSGASYGVNIMPGYRLPSGPLAFLKLGYVRTDFTAQEWSVGTFGTSSKSSQWLNGFSYGVGIQTDLYKGFGMRVEYNRINYNRLTNPATGSTFELSDNQATLGVLYNFRF